MDNFDNLDPVAFKNDTPVDNAIIEAVGKFMLNCGQIENFSRNCLVELMPNDQRQAFKECKNRWNRRSEKLKTLVEETYKQNPVKEEILDILVRIDSLFKDFRNRIGHASLWENDHKNIFLLETNPDSESDDREKAFNIKVHISLEEINKKIDESADLFNEWWEMWDRLKKNKP